MQKTPFSVAINCFSFTCSFFVILIFFKKWWRGMMSNKNLFHKKVILPNFEAENQKRQIFL